MTAAVEDIFSSAASQPALRAPLLEICDLSVQYLTARGPVRAVEQVSLAIQPGEVFGLAGESGSGKSTLAHAVLRILRPPAIISGGQVRFRNQDVLAMSMDELEAFRWRELSIVFQSAMNALNPVMTVGDQLADVIIHHEKQTKAAALERAVELFDLVGLERARIGSYPHQLSGGMRQRVVIAIALALKPPMIMMDEPTTALDVVVQRDILQQIEALKEKVGFSVLFVTHDLSLLVEFANRIAIMYAGEVVEQGEARLLFDNPLHPYTQGLMNSFPSISGPRKKLAGIPGAPPDMIAPPPGCRFHPRCALVQEVCRSARPTLREVALNRFAACHLLNGDRL